MKKITYGLKFGIIGKSNGPRAKFRNYLKSISFEAKEVSKDSWGVTEKFFILYSSIPLSMTLHEESTIDSFLDTHANLITLDALLLFLSMDQKSNLHHFEPQLLKKLEVYYDFKGIDALIGMNILPQDNNDAQIDPSKGILKEELVDKAKYLDVLYCFEIINEPEDFQEIMDKILRFFLLKFKISSPEIYKQAKNYGLSLMKKN
ncbi:MAG: hypothetical protein ACTSXH_01510 [Promethearchaeota archaeon]